MSENRLFGVYGLDHAFGAVQVLSEVSFELERGKVYALLGPNGSGKSTLLKLISGVLPFRANQTQGQVKFLTSDFLKLSHAEKASRVAYLISDLQISFPVSAREVVGLGRICHPGSSQDQTHSDLVQAAMERALCWGLRDREFRTLSGGERQLVALARALAQAPRILMLDEATSKMDLHHQQAVGRLIAELAHEGLTVVLVSHDLNLACEYCDEAIVLERGKVIANGPLMQVMTGGLLEKLYPGAQLSVGQNSRTQRPHVFF